MSEIGWFHEIKMKGPGDFRHKFSSIGHSRPASVNRLRWETELESVDSAAGLSRLLGQTAGSCQNLGRIESSPSVSFLF
jgi:hypothetical protein